MLKRTITCYIANDNWLNPVRAQMVLHPADYRWSSYRSNAQGEANKLIKPHFMYDELGVTEAARQVSFREFFRYNREPGLVDEIRKATNGIFVFGNDRFKGEIRNSLGRRVTPGKAGEGS